VQAIAALVGQRNSDAPSLRVRDMAKNDAHWQHSAPPFLAIKFSIKSVEQHKKVRDKQLYKHKINHPHQKGIKPTYLIVRLVSSTLYIL
jgi:hypothetical protein